MADVVEIARRRRANLAAEITKLDEFISMAEMLLEFENARADEASGLGEFPEHPAAQIRSDSEKERMPNDEANEPVSIGQMDVGVPVAASQSAASDTRVPRADADTGREVIGPQPNDETNEEELHLDSRTDATVGQKVRQRRWMMGITKSALAERIGIPAIELQNFELGLTHLDRSRLEKLAEVLDVATSYLFEDEERLLTGADRGGDVHQLGPEEQPPATAALARTA